MPKDQNGYPIPALRLSTGGAHAINATATATRNTSDFNTNCRVISLYATENVYVEVGDATVEATTSSHFFPKGVYYDVALIDDNVSKIRDTHISVLKYGADDGVLFVSEKL